MRKYIWLANALFGLVLCFGIMIIWLTFISPNDGRAPTIDMTTHQNLRVLAVALNHYHDDFGCYPPTWVSDENRRPLYSWRVLLLPYLDNKLVYEQFHLDEPWDSPHNKKLSKTYFPMFQNRRNKLGSATTNYVAIVGGIGPWRGSESVSKSDFASMPASTIWLAEQNVKQINWAEPRDLNMTKMPLRINDRSGDGISGISDGGANVLLIDGKVIFLTDEMSEKQLANMLGVELDK